MLDSLRQLAIFAKTVECGSFNKAATELNLSPSVVSYHIAQLEAHYKTPLLYRTTRSLSLTDEGENAYAYARQMLIEAQNSILCLTNASHELRGKITLTFPAVLIKSALFEKVTRFFTDNPQVACQMLITDQTLNLIDKGIDLAFHIGEVAHNLASVRQKKIGQINRILVAHHQLVHQYGMPKSADQLSQWPWIGLDMLPYSRRLYNPAGEVITINYKPRITVDSVEAMTELVLQGTGIATPPDYLLQSALDKKTIVRLFADYHVPPLDIMALWPKHSQQHAITRQLIQSLLCD